MNVCPSLIILFLAASFVLVFSFVRGGAPERRLGQAMAGILLLDLVCDAFSGPMSDYGWIHLWIDLLGFAVMTVVALRANRVYPLVLCAAQMVKVSLHVLCLALARPSTFVYAILDQAAFYLQLAVLGLGIGMHAARLVRNATLYRDWSDEPRKA